MSNYGRPRYRKRYEHLRHRGIPTSYVDATPVREHINRVLDLGFSASSLAHMTDVTVGTILNTATGHYPTLERRTVAALLEIPYSYHVPDCIPDEAFVASGGATRRMRALLTLGYTRANITQLCGEWDVSHVARDLYPRIPAGKWRAVDAVYQQLHMTKGPSNIGSKRAIALDYSPPMAWLDIDNPDETPAAGYRPTKKRPPAELLAEWEHLRGFGLSVHHACQQLGVTYDAIAVAKSRLDGAA